MKRRALWIEIAALAAIAGVAWWLCARAADAWLARVATVEGVRAPAREVVVAASRHACTLFTLAIVLVAGARWFATRRARDPIAVPWLIPAAFAACALGLVLQQSTVEVVRGVALAPTATAFAQGVLIGAALGAVVIAAPVDLVQLASRGRTAIAAVIALVFVALAIAGSGPAGSHTRINLGPVQPIEIVKLLVVVFLAVFLGARAGKLRWHRRRVLGLRWPRIELLVPAFAALVAIVAGLYVLGDLGPVLLLALIFLGMFYAVSGATGWAVTASALLATLLVLLHRWPSLAGAGTVRTRLVMWSDPWTNGLANGHQLGDGRWALAAGGATGQGLAHHAIPIVPAGKTDLALATLGEQLGVVGLVAYQIAIVGIVIGGVVVATRARTVERSLIAAGLALLVLVQWIVIQAGTLGQLPLTGIVVPFVSSGRSSMIVFVLVVALIARVAGDGHPRERSSELDDVHRGARGLSIAMYLLAGLSIVAGLLAYRDRHATSARTIAVTLADGTRIARENPRLRVLADRVRRGAILDRDGQPLAQSPARGARTYPLKSALGTLLGVDPSPILLPPWALERALDERLRGYRDLQRFAPWLDLSRAERDQALAVLDSEIAQRSVRITLDADLQSAVATLLAKARVRHSASAVVIDVDSGHVLARAQVPDLDPGDRGWIAKARARDPSFVGAYGAWPDKTGVHGMFQAGSIAKLFTALAAVRSGSASPRFSCVERDAQGPLFTRPGWPRPIHDHSNDSPHGDVDLVEGLAVSCNVFFAQLGLALGPAPLVELHGLGVDIGFGRALEPGEPGSRQLGSTAFGQGAMVTSTMQAARLVAAIAAGGRYRRCPSSMQLDAACLETPLVTDPESVRPIVEGMRRVMTAGTGARLRSPAGVRVYGKTGTADVRGFRGEEPHGIAPGANASPHSWFVAFAEPASAVENAVETKGRIAIAVVVPRGGSGASAAGPLAMQIVEAVQAAGYLAR